MAVKFTDDKFDHLKSDIDKIRIRHRQYISYSNEAGAKSVVDEIINNALDECRSTRSPGNHIYITFDERNGFIEVKDNGRGIPTDILEEVFTSLNMGSNIYTANKADLKVETLGQNGTGTLAICGLAEHVEITSNRGGTENLSKTIIFEEGKKVSESTHKVPESNHGLIIKYKPSKVMGKNTRIVWKDIEEELHNLQYLIKDKIKIESDYIGKDNTVKHEVYKLHDFSDILNTRNDPEEMISPVVSMVVTDDNVTEELEGTSVNRFIELDIAFVYTNSMNPYIDSFSNSNNTVENGDHLDGVMESLCRYFQSVTKQSLGEKEKDKIDIKWDDVRMGLSLAVSMRTNFERLYTNQSKHRVVNEDIKRIIMNLVTDSLGTYFSGKNVNQLKTIINIVKMNARARRESDKVRNAVVKDRLTNWSSYKMKNYDPCTAKGNEYKELFIVEGD